MKDFKGHCKKYWHCQKTLLRSNHPNGPSIQNLYGLQQNNDSHWFMPLSNSMHAGLRYARGLHYLDMFWKSIVVNKNFQTWLLIGWRLPASQSGARFENFCRSTWILIWGVLSEKGLLMQTGSESLQLMPRLLCYQGIGTHNNEHTAQTDHYLPSVWKSSTFDHSLTKKMSISIPRTQ